MEVVMGKDSAFRRSGVLLLMLWVLPQCTAAAQNEPATLLRLHDEAVNHDPRLQAARRRLDAGDEAVVQGRAGLLPSIGISAEQARERYWSGQPELANQPARQRQDVAQTQLQISFSQPVFRLDRWYTYRQSQIEQLLARAEFRQELQQFNERLIRHYVETLRAQIRLDTALARLEAATAQEMQARSRLQAGLSSRLDVIQAQAEQRRVQAETIRIRGEVVEGFRELESIVGVPLSDIASFDAVFDPRNHKAKPLELLIREGLENSPHVMAAELTLRRARYQSRLAASGHYPTLDLVMTAGREDTDLMHSSGSEFGTETDTIRLALQFSLPLFSGGRTSSESREARLRQAEAAENMRAQVETTRRQVEASYRDLKTLTQTLTAAEMSLDAQRVALEATERSYQAGLRDTVDVLQAQRAVFDAELNVQEIRLDYVLRLAELNQTVGQLDQEFIRSVDNWLEVS